MPAILSIAKNRIKERWIYKASINMKRLIKTRIKIEPFKIYQVDNDFIVEKDDIEVFKTKHQHLTTSFCQIKLAEERNRKNDLIRQSVLELKAQGIL